MAISLVGNAFTANGGPNSISVTYSSTAGNGLIVLVSAAYASGSGTISDTQGNTWTNPYPWTQYSGNGAFLVAFYCQSNKGGAGNVITVNGLYSFAPQADIYVAEYSGIGAFDNASTINGVTSGNSSFSTNSAVPSVAGELAIGLGGSVNFTGGWTGWTGGFSSEANGDLSGWADQVLTSTSSVSTSGSTGNVIWSAVMLLFEPFVTPPFLPLLGQILM